ncbi:hypothetical protein QCN29_28530 [Streptomyces sp. HNM0663]|uniref:Uncharacterized protein n=1 Tax=Streptomyces chengmaiensis TaxID=3040919 RepID=A0ABT6HVC5_9ACTN|nr:hypothetical protein [Streptomyces chengmaiensis]MDH2392655.1 hypothetical protein [Streptomyces chengmaiensis]
MSCGRPADGASVNAHRPAPSVQADAAGGAPRRSNPGTRGRVRAVVRLHIEHVDGGGEAFLPPRGGRKEA